MKMAPFFSIIIPVYNVRPYLADCLDSVIRATNKSPVRVEVICVDDGSTDGSGAVLDEYAERRSLSVSRFSVIRQTNSGVAKARNVALDQASGEWVWFVDSDDCIHPDSLVWAHAHILLYPDAETITFGYARDDALFANPNHFPNLSQSLVELRSDRSSSTFAAHRKGACCCMIRRSAMGSLRLKPYTIGEDTLFLSNIYWNTTRWIITNAPAYFYRKRLGSAWLQPPSQRAVGDFLETKILSLQEMENRKQDWTIEDFVSFFDWFRDYIYYCNETFPMLSNDARKELLPQWVSLQRLFFSVSGQHRPWRLFVCRIVTMFPSGLLAKFLILLPRRLRHRKMRLKNFIKRQFRFPN